MLQHPSDVGESTCDDCHATCYSSVLAEDTLFSLILFQQDRDKWMNVLTSHQPAPRPIRKERSDEYPKPYEVPVNSINRNRTGSYDDIVLKTTPPKVPQPQEHIYQEPQLPTAPQEHQKAYPTSYDSLLHTGSFGGEGVKPKASQYDHTSSKYPAPQRDTGKFPEHPETPTSKGATYTYIDDYDFSTAARKQSKEERPGVKRSERKSSSSDYYFPMTPYFDADKPPLRASSQSTHTHPQLHDPPPPPPEPHHTQHHSQSEASTDISPGSNLTQEQLLAYMQAFQFASQAGSQFDAPQPGNPGGMRSEFVNMPPKQLYLNVMEANFDKPPVEIPPPLPPKPNVPRASWSKSSQDFGMLHFTHEHGRNSQACGSAATISKSQSVLLQGSSAEAVRQRYNHRTRNPSDHFRPQANVRFQFAEVIEDEVFAQSAAVRHAAVRHAASSEHLLDECPPLPPRPRKSEEREYQNFGPTAHRPNIPKRSQTMKPYLASEVDYRRKYMHEEESGNHWSEGRPSAWQGQTEWNNHQSTQSTMPKMEEVLGE